MAGGRRRTAERDRGTAPVEQPEARTRRVVHRQRPSINGGIADAIVLKAGEVFFLARPTGDVPLDDGDDQPVRYPVACHPQAWAAGSMLYLLTSLLGLRPCALERRLAIVRPVLPEGVRRVELQRLRVGDARADLEFIRGGDGHVRVVIGHVDGDLDVSVHDARDAE